MSAVETLPTLPSAVAPATMGPVVPLAAALGKELRQTLPPALVEALDRIGDQIEVEIIDPLLCAATVEQMARTFERVFAKFRDYYVSTVLILWGCLEEDPQRFTALTARSFQESKQLIRQRGPHWIGQDASLNALQGLATITRVATAATKLFDKEKSSELQPCKSDQEQWANSIIAYVMAFSCVLSSLTALAGRKTASVRLDNVVALAHWSKSYAVQAYHFSKAIGLVAAAPRGSPVTDSDDEDVALAEAGLEGYAESLAQDD